MTRFTYTLTKLGYLVQQSSGRYMLGAATLGLGSAMLARLDIRQLARPMMQELAEFSGATVSIAMRDHLNCGGLSSSVSQQFLLDEVRPRLIALAARPEP